MPRRPPPPLPPEATTEPTFERPQLYSRLAFAEPEPCADTCEGEILPLEDPHG